MELHKYLVLLEQAATPKQTVQPEAISLNCSVPELFKYFRQIWYVFAKQWAWPMTLMAMLKTKTRKEK